MERWLPCSQMIEHGAKSVHVRLHRDFLAPLRLRQLRGHEAKCAGDMTVRACLCLACDSCGQPEVHNPRLVRMVNKDVRTLQIEVQYSALVSIVDCFCDRF